MTSHDLQLFQNKRLWRSWARSEERNSSRMAAQDNRWPIASHFWQIPPSIPQTRPKHHSYSIYWSGAGSCISILVQGVGNKTTRTRFLFNFSSALQQLKEVKDQWGGILAAVFARIMKRKSIFSKLATLKIIWMKLCQIICTFNLQKGLSTKLS